MDLDRLRPVFEENGPYLMLHVDLSRNDEHGAEQIESRGQVDTVVADLELLAETPALLVREAIVECRGDPFRDLLEQPRRMAVPSTRGTRHEMQRTEAAVIDVQWENDD